MDGHATPSQRSGGCLIRYTYLIGRKRNLVTLSHGNPNPILVLVIKIERIRGLQGNISFCTENFLNSPSRHELEKLWDHQAFFFSLSAPWAHTYTTLNQPFSFYILGIAGSGASTYSDRGSKEAMAQKALMTKMLKAQLSHC